jgi:hypothetical protein
MQMSFFSFSSRLENSERMTISLREWGCFLFVIMRMLTNNVGDQRRKRRYHSRERLRTQMTAVLPVSDRSCFYFFRGVNTHNYLYAHNKRRAAAGGGTWFHGILWWPLNSMATASWMDARLGCHCPAAILIPHYPPKFYIKQNKKRVGICGSPILENAKWRDRDINKARYYYRNIRRMAVATGMNQ